jgi:hypothetical protein
VWRRAVLDSWSHLAWSHLAWSHLGAARCGAELVASLALPRISARDLKRALENAARVRRRPPQGTLQPVVRVQYSGFPRTGCSHPMVLVSTALRAMTALFVSIAQATGGGGGGGVAAPPVRLGSRSAAVIRVDGSRTNLR